MREFERRTFTADVSELRRLSAWWNDWAAWARLSDEPSYRGELCLNEAVANVILHGCGDGAAHEITITLERLDGQVRMTLEDNGSAFDPLRHPRPAPLTTLEDAPVGGLGVELLRIYSTEACYRHESGRNVLTLVVDG